MARIKLFELREAVPHWNPIGKTPPGRIFINILVKKVFVLFRRYCSFSSSLYTYCDWVSVLQFFFAIVS